MRRLIFLMAVLVGLTACGGKSDLGPATPFASPRPYQTATPAATLFVVTPLPPLTEMLLPTPTPFTYTVAAGDTLSGIATRFDVRLDDLLTANPGLSPTALQVGALLTIPLGGNTSGEPTPTPVPLAILQTDCWPSAEGGLWCFALAHNNYAEIIENLSMQITLLDDSGQEIGSQVAYGLLNILPAGRKMPLAAFFPAPLPADVHPRAQVLTAIRLSADDLRYLPIALQNTLVRVDWPGRTAHVTGRAALTTQSATAGTLWVLGVAYDQYGHVVGVRRWNASEPLKADSILAFDFLVYSLSAPIDYLDLLVEAR
ncbi:MAG: LysM peptidoglycan-binding domain-containing protein [Anaerolineales bacterium]|nr:LysM peptidoglycan-binding domain-containing protein [Anaerolineales bacterium]